DREVRGLAAVGKRDGRAGAVGDRGPVRTGAGGGQREGAGGLIGGERVGGAVAQAQQPLVGGQRYALVRERASGVDQDDVVCRRVGGGERHEGMLEGAV